MLSREEYASVVEHAPLMIWRADASSSRDYFNEKWLRFRGRTLEQEQGEGWTEGVHPADVAERMNVWRAHFALRQPFDLEYRLRRHDGEYRWIYDVGAPVYGSDGSFRGFVGSCMEVAPQAGRGAEKRGGVWPLCSWCRRVRAEDGAWQELERYLTEHCNIAFTHGICPACMAEQGFEGGKGNQNNAAV